MIPGDEKADNLKEKEKEKEKEKTRSVQLWRVMRDER